MSANKSYDIAQCFTRLFRLTRPKKAEQLMKPTQLMVMLAIVRSKETGKDGITPSEICHELGFSKSGLTALLNSLEQSGYIYRELSSEDRRKIIIRVTSKAEKIHEQFHNGVNSNLSGLSEYLGEDDTDELLRLLEKTYAYLITRKENTCE